MAEPGGPVPRRQATPACWTTSAACGGEAVWLVLCGVVLLASMVGAAAGTTPGAVAILVIEHLVVGAVIALGLRRAGQRATAASALA